MLKRLNLILVFILSVIIFKFSYSASVNSIYLNEGLTENQAYNIKVYTTRALNLILDAQRALKKKKVIRKEVYMYLDGALYFLNEAGQYSPSYLIKREIEATIKMIELFPEEDYTLNLKGIDVGLQELAGNLSNYQYIRKSIDSLLQIAPMKRNQKIKDKLETIKYTIKIPLIDDNINTAKNLIASAKDHIKAKSYIKAQKSLELAISPLERLAFRENLFVVLAKEYVYKAKISLRIDLSLTEKYLVSALYASNKAYYVSSIENKDILNNVRYDILKIGNILEKYENLKKLPDDKLREIETIIDKIQKNLYSITN